MEGAGRSITLPSKIRLQTTREYMPEDPDDPLKPCPLVPAHRILSSRMALHLVKCREAQTLKIPMAQCMLDSTHWVPKKELAHHMANECDKREFFERFWSPLDGPCPKAEPYQPPELPQFEENWDDGPSVSYDPTTKAENEAVLRIHSVGSKKERKRFRNNERLRLQELEREGKLLSGTYTKPPAKPPPQLRPPRKETQDQIASVISGQEKKESLPVTAGVGVTVTSDIARSLKQLDLEKAPAKKDGTWVCVGKGRRKAGKKQ